MRGPLATPLASLRLRQRSPNVESAREDSASGASAHIGCRTPGASDGGTRIGRLVPQAPAPPRLGQPCLLLSRPGTRRMTMTRTLGSDRRTKSLLGHVLGGPADARPKPGARRDSTFLHPLVVLHCPALRLAPWALGASLPPTRSVGHLS